MADTSSPGAGTQRKRTNPVLLVLIAIVVAGAIWGAYWLTQVHQPLAENQALNTQLVTRTVGLADPRPVKLDEKYKDADGDLVADAPVDARELIDPGKLAFSYVATEETGQYHAAFAELVQHIAKVTGRPAEYLEFKTPEMELRAMREGRLHVAGLNTGSVPLAVNWCGFVPVCRLATADGVATYQMEIIVPAASGIHALSDLRGHELVLTEPGSNSGFKAPLVLLAKDNELEPVKDFRLRYSGGHVASIAGIASKQYEAAAVANEVLARERAAGRIKTEQYRSICKSADFPTASFGYLYNVKPELAAKIKQALFSFDWKGTKLEKEFQPSGLCKFVPVDYAKDWASVRRLDNEIRLSQTLEAVLAATQPVEEEATTAPSQEENITQEEAERRLRGN